MFVSFAHRTAQGTATGGPLSSVPTGADIEGTHSQAFARKQA